MITPEQLEALNDDALVTFLITLFEADDNLYGGEIDYDHDFIIFTVLYSAWNEKRQARTLRAIVSEPLDEVTVDELTDDLADYLRQLRQTEREEQIQQYLTEGKLIGEAQALASDYVDDNTPDHIELYVQESQIDNDILLADLLGVFNPMVVLHIVPDDLIEEGVPHE